MKTIQEIYEQESIRLIEDAIFEACREHERMKFADPYGKNVTRLLKICTLYLLFTTCFNTWNFLFSTCFGCVNLK